ncbi:uncharacterized protein LOC123272919 [Cotesia glomerata]|uniref:Uncharacterized protein n=1 Tax=Cotesia glomerata TaxID=32391 RepID=A0AAV7J1H2_COTGL|nr:uncharacterized protein LOC123272919 [Cotesia glomerata]KAH0563670.1 hypothetical protein KQX54_004292 [Cotesia glomerata]
MSKVRKTKHALIWWIDTKETDILPLIKIPKEHRKLHAVAELTWVDNKTKRTSKSKMKVLAIDTNAKNLKNMLINTNGEITTPSDKIFNPEVIDKRKQLIENIKLQNGIKTSNRNKIETKILSQKPILSKLFPFHNQNQFVNQANYTSIPSTSSNLGQAFQALSSSTPESTSQKFFNPVSTSQLETTSSQAQSPQFQPFLTQLQASSTLCTSVQKNNDYFSSKPSIISTLNYDQQDTYEFPPNVHTRPVGQVINLRNVNQSTTNAQETPVSQNIQENERMYENEKTVTVVKSVVPSNEMTNLLSQLVPKKLTLEVVEFVEALAINLRHKYNEEHHNTSKESVFTLPMQYFESGKDKVEISPGIGFYMCKSVLSDIKERASNNWRELVIITLDEVYGKKLPNFSAKGRKSNKRPGINSTFFKGLYCWAKKIDNSITLKQFTKAINDHAGNLRKSKNKQTKQNDKRRSRIIVSDEEEMSVEEDYTEDEDETDEDKENANEDGDKKDGNKEDEVLDNNDNNDETIEKNQHLEYYSDESFLLSY